MLISAQILKSIGLANLRFKKQCQLVATEVGYFRADILASNNKYLYEMEVKISVSDFRHDASKTVKHYMYQNCADVEVLKANIAVAKELSISARQLNYMLPDVPNFLFYLVPSTISQQCLDLMKSDVQYAKYGLAVVDVCDRIYSDNIRVLKRPSKLHTREVSDSAKLTLLSRMSSELCNFHLCQRHYIDMMNRMQQHLENIHGDLNAEKGN